MTHTSTEQPEALRLADALAERVSLTATGFGFDADLAYSAAELRRLHARVQELEAQTAHMADLVELADYATKKLEAAQAQRVPLDVATIAEIAESFGAADPTDSFWVEVCRAFEGASVSGITQEKQG